MKTGLFILMLVVIPVVVLGNPAYPFDASDPPRFLSELWFAENGHLMAEFAAYDLPVGDSVRIYLVHDFQNMYDEWFYQIPSDAKMLDIAVPTFENPQVVDITELLPELVFDIEEDSVCLALAAYPISGYYHTYWNHTIRWSNNLEFYGKNLKPLLPGQSYVWCGLYQWAKDEPPTPGTHLYSPVARTVIKIKITDQDNHPVPYVNHYSYLSDDYMETDSHGEMSDVIYAGKYYLYLRHPITGGLACREVYWAEPNDTLVIPVQLEMPTEYPYSEYKGLQAYPSPLNLKNENMIRFRYYGKLDAKSVSYVKIYDVKGRFLAREGIGIKGFSSWYLPPDIASGIYIAQMISDNKIVDAVTFTILK